MYQKINKMIKELELRGRSASTIKNRICTLKCFSKFYNQSPELLGEQQIVYYLDYCINKKECKYFLRDRKRDSVLVIVLNDMLIMV